MMTLVRVCQTCWKISKLSHDEEASEAAQQQFAEIVEHVRIVTLMLKESMNPLKSAPTVH
jgi:uncharacterized protein YgfB (UPF0149 family)